VASKPEADAAARLPSRKAIRRGRPSAARVAAIEDEILSAAHALFLEFGYESASMEGVAERAGISKGTLYARYVSKEALFRAVNRKRLDLWSARASAQDYLLPTDIAPRLAHHARTLARMFAWPEYRETSQLVQTTARSFPDIAAYWQEQGTRQYIDFLAADMAAAAGSDYARSPDWHFLANLFLHAFAGWFTLENSAGSVSDERVESFVEQLVETILAALAAHRKY